MSRIESANYKFVQNTACEYFPCHKGIDDHDFNCLFCYCPMYFLTECLGRPKMVQGKGRMVKDCTLCTVPHQRDSYDQIVAVLHKEIGASHG